MSWLDTLLYGVKDILEAGNARPARPALNFVSGATVVDNAGANRLDVTVAGSTPSNVTPAEVANGAGAIGVSALYARADHVHSHGNRAGGTLHAVAVGAPTPANGFMSGADKVALDQAIIDITLLGTVFGSATPDADPNTLCSRGGSAETAFSYVNLEPIADPGAHASMARLVRDSAGLTLLRTPNAGGLVIDQQAIGGLDAGLAFGIYAELASPTGPRVLLNPTGTVIRLDDGTTGIAVTTGNTCLVAPDAACTSVTIAQADRAGSDGAGVGLTIKAQKGRGALAGHVGGTLTIGGGDAGTSGNALAGDTVVQLGALASNASAGLFLKSGATDLLKLWQSSNLVTEFTFGASRTFYATFGAASWQAQAYVNIGCGTDLYLTAPTMRLTGVNGEALQFLLNGSSTSRAVWQAGVTAVQYEQADTTAATGAPMSIRAQKTTHATGVGGQVALFGGEGKTGGLASLKGGAGFGTDADGGHVEIAGGAKTGSGKSGNIGIHGSPASWNSAERVEYVANRTAVPTGNPTNGFYAWSESGQPTSREPNKVVDGYAYVSKRTDGTSRKRILLEDGKTISGAAANATIALIPAATWPSGNCLSVVTLDVIGYDATDNTHFRGYRKFAVRKTSSTLTIGAIDNPGTDENTTTGVNPTFSAALNSGDVVFRVTQEQHDLRWSVWLEVKVSEH